MLNEIRFGATATPARSSAPKAAPAPAPASSDKVETGSAARSEFRLTDLLAATANEARSLETKLPEHVEGEVLVKLKPGMGLLSTDEFAGQYGASVAETIHLPQQLGLEGAGGDLLRIQLNGMTTAEAIVAMSKDPRVAYAETNDRIEVPTTFESGRSPEAGLNSDVPNEGPQNLPGNLSPKLWGLHNTGQNGGKVDTDIDAPEAWATTTGGRQHVIAVIDTGTDYTHKALAGNIWTNPKDGTHGFNAITGSHDPMDDHYHGTHCAGTIGANGTDGVYGVSHQAQLMPIKFLSGSGGGTLADAIKGIVFATENGARVTSNSWGGGGYNQALKDAFASSPALHIIAAGNESNNNDASPTYPATYGLDNIISVAASDRKDQLASFTNYGEKTVHVSAPGVAIYSTAPGNKYKDLDGTSMACPHVSGVAGLILAQYPEISNEELKARLMNSVDDVPNFQGKVVTAGRVNAARALAPDHAAPGTPADFGVAEAKAGKVTLNWVASGDDGAEGGKAARYQVRVSDRPIADGPAGPGEVSFDEAQTVTVTRPQDPGSAERLAVDVPLSGKEKTYYFAIKAGDKVGKSSAMASAVATVPAAQVAFEDDGNAANWSSASWTQVDNGGRKVWTDSANGNYDNNANSQITSKTISLANLSGSKLIFDAKYATENKYDNVALQVSSDGGKTWTKEANYSGSSDWKSQTVDLSKYDGKDVQFRFNLTSDGSVNGDGFSFSNLVVAGGQN
jgi:subtilisin family serine protease